MTKARDVADLGAIDQELATTDSPTFVAVNAGDVNITGPTPILTLTDNEVADEYTLIQNGTGNTFIDSRKGTSNGATVFRGNDGTSNTEYARFDSNGNFGIGTASPAQAVHVQSTGSATVIAERTGTNAGIVGLYASQNPAIVWGTSSDSLRFAQVDDTALGGFSERMRIDTSGSVLVGKTTADNTTAGTTLYRDGLGVSIVRDGANPLIINRLTSDGNITEFRKDGATVGSIGTAGSLYVASGDVGLRFVDATPDRIIPTNGSGAGRDNAIDLGITAARFDDIYATNGTIQTSDRNEKEAIASLTPAEMLVAARLSSSFKNFKWKDAVAEKGAAARMHSGIIAQDVQAAFTAEGLDAGDYSMFISGTWWEHEGTTYDTLEEAPEGATERTRLGVRYPELLAFVAAYSDQRFISIEARVAALEAAP